MESDPIAVRSQKSAANTSRGFGPSVMKHTERPGWYVRPRSSLCNASSLASASSSKASALALLRLLRRQRR